jgi:hypothetical protein
MINTSILPPALPETNYPTKASNKPNMSLDTALQLFIRAGGVTQRVGACSEADFEAFIEQTLAEYQHSKKASQERLDACLMELAGVEYDELGKWFCLETLAFYRIKTPVFHSYDACASEHQEMLS